MSQASDYRKPRIVLELQDDGTLVAEYYINGSRKREQAFGEYDIMLALKDVQRDIARSRQHEAERIAQAQADLHRKNYYETRWRHGEAFADRTITRPKGIRGAQAPRPADPLAAPNVTVMSEDLL